MKSFVTRFSAVLTPFALAITLIIGLAPNAQSNTTYVEGTDPQAVMFNPLKVLNMNFTLPESSIANLLEDPETYQPATMSYVKPDGSAVGPFTISIRLKGGWGSWRDLSGKSGFKIKIPSSARSNIFGLKKLTLNNMVQDPSFSHEALAYQLFRSVGIAAPRVGYAWVSVNGSTYGLYANIETPDDLMLSRWFESTQHLYEGAYWADLFPDSESYFEVDEGDEEDRSDLTALINANLLDGDAWFAAIQEVADVEQFVKMWAVETFIGHWDGYSFVIKNNYYLHSDDSGLFSMLPWGTDQTWNEYLPYHDTTDRALMFQKCLSHLPCRGMYDQAISQVVLSAKNLKLTTLLERIRKIITPHIQLDPRKEVSNEEAANWQKSAGRFITARIKQTETLVRTFVTPAPRAKLVVRNDQVTVSWAPVTNAIYPTISYEIEVSTSAGSTFHTTTSTSIILAKPASTAKYRVRAVSYFGPSAWSGWVTSRR